jgi:hypothetical protein
VPSKAISLPITGRVTCPAIHIVTTNRARRTLRITVSINVLPVAKRTLAPALILIFIAAST